MKKKKPAKKTVSKKAKAKKPAAKKAPARAKAPKPTPSTKAAGGSGTYTPQPVSGIGWAPFRYPLT
jgi:hypothetical protein